MFKIGDRVVYGAQGVCEITDIKEENLTSVLREYYIISPVDNEKSVIYVPVDNEKLTSRMKIIPTKSELEKILGDAKKVELEWKENYLERSEYFQSLINCGEISCMTALFYTLYRKASELNESGKGLKKSDERIYKECTRILGRTVANIMGTDIDAAVQILIHNAR